MHDVAIVGGGPAGLFTGTLLARQGYDVVVCEEHATVGEPVHCAGVLATHAFDEFGLSRSAILNDLPGARFHAPSGAVVAYRSPTVEAAAIDRCEFDRSLQDEARAAGVRALPGAHVHEVDVGPRAVVLRSAGLEPVRARAAVLACGARYGLQRALGLGLPARFLQTVLVELPSRPDDEVEVHFGREVAPNGFGWVIPVRRGGTSRARIGIMCDRHATAYFQRLLASVADRWAIDPTGARAETPRLRMLPLAPLPRTWSPRVLAVGDAAGLVKATTGGGIYYSLVSASLAAAVLGDALRRDALDGTTLAEYERRWRQRLGPELDAQLALRRLADRLTDAHIDSLFDLARTDGIMPLMRRTARFNEHRHFILALLKHPPARRVLFQRLLGTA